MFPLLALPWLAFCAWHDLKTRTVPPLLTIPPLAASLLLHGILDSWPVAVLAATLTILNDVPWRWRGILGGAQGLLLLATWFVAGPSSVVLGLVLIGVWFSWKLGALGGADAHVVMTLLLFFGLPVLLPVALATGLQAVIQRLRGKETLPAMLGILAGVCLYTI